MNGAVIALLEQARRLRRAGHDVEVVIPPLSGPADALRDRFIQAGIELVSAVPLDRTDLFVGCTVFAADALFEVVGKKPVIWWIHEGRAGVRHILVTPKAAAVYGQADVLAFPSRAVAEEIYAPALPRSRGRVEIVPGIVAPPEPGPAAQKSVGRPRVLCVGSVYPRKRQSDLVQAIAALQGAAVECVLAGQLFELAEPGRTIAAADPERYILPGGLPPDHVQQLYRSADIFCLPSEDECMPLAPVEAAWHNVPIILSDLEAYRGVWRHGENALLYPVGDVELLAWSVKMLLESSSLRARLARGGRAVTVGFSEARAAAAFDALMEAALAGRR